jgi:NAD(P)-dependent dehydrogenase (short-subunit alcohol dehydrogenase family)
MSGRIALITGANRGLGRETARQLLQRGYKVVLTSRDPEKGRQAAQALEQLGPIRFHPLDVTQGESIQALRTWVEREYGRLDVLINNAAVYLEDDQSILSIPEQVIRQTLETNTLGPLWLCRAFLSMMQARNYGRVVNVSSGMGQMDDLDDYGAAYRLSKLALNGLTRILCDAVRGSNILVNAVCPGWVRTDMGGAGAPRSLEQGAQGIVWAASLPDGGPSGGFFRDGKAVPW